VIILGTQMMTNRLLSASFAAITTIPALLYVVLERFVLRGNTAVMGAR
jgi:hypothetical protein